MTKNYDCIGIDGTEDVWHVDCKDISDGHHTMSELYQHRYVLFHALIKAYDKYLTPLNSNVKCWKSKLHSDGTMFDNSFVVGMSVFKRDFDGTETVKQITYHYPLDWWYRFDCIELEKAPPYDGHSSNDVLERLLSL